MKNLLIIQRRSQIHSESLYWILLYNVSEIQYRVSKIRILKGYRYNNITK